MSKPPLVKRAVRRLLNPNGGVIRQGEFITFRPTGFVEAKDPAALLCRHYYEVMHLRKCLDLMPEYGIEAKRSLEIGCGFGRLSPYIAERAQQHTAVDINTWAIDQATQYYPHIAFQVGSATELPFPDHSFDVIVTWTVLQHVPNALAPKAITEIRRVAKPKSLLILCEATLNAGTGPEKPGQHTHDRFPEFYAEGLPGHCMVVSEFIAELDRIPAIQSPGRLMVFVPK